MLICRAGILSQSGDQPVPFFGRNSGKKHLRERNFQRCFRQSESLSRFRMGVGVGEIGLDIKNRCSIHQIRTADTDHSASGCIPVDPRQFHGRQADGIGTEGGTGGEHTHTGIPAQLGRTDRGVPAAASVRCGLSVFRKLPQEPQMRVFFQSPERIGIPVFRLEHDNRFHRGQSALSGNSEFSRKVVVDMCDAPASHFRHNKCFLRCVLPYTVQS